MALETATHKPLCWFHNVDDTFVIWPHGPGKLAEFLDHFNGVHENIKFTMETERDGHLPFPDNDNTINPMAHWAIESTINPHTPTSISMLTLTTTLPTNRLCFPCLYIGPEACVITEASLMGWSFSMTHSSETAMMTGRSNGLSIHRKSRYHPGEAHFGCLSSLCQHDFQSHQLYAIQAQHQVCGSSAKENC
jgi:hypothetical protein